MKTLTILLTLVFVAAAATTPYPSFTPGEIIGEGIQEPRWVTSGMIDSDSWVDVAYVSTDTPVTAMWVRNLGSGVFSDPITISSRYYAIQCIQLGDIDGDGDTDVLLTGRAGPFVVWSENMDGEGTFLPTTDIPVVNVRTPFARLFDVDKDGDLDVVYPGNEFDSEFRIALNNGLGTSWATQNGPSFPGQVYNAEVADLNLDGELDLVGVSCDRPEDHEVIVSLGPSFSSSQEYGASASHCINAVVAINITDDEFPEIAFISEYSYGLTYLLNLGPSGPTVFDSIPITIDEDLFIPRSLIAIDFVGSPYKELFVASQQSSSLLWYENFGNGTFSSRNTITTAASGTFHVHVRDLDGDGVLDALSANYGGNTIGFFRGRYWVPSVSTLVVNEQGTVVANVGQAVSLVLVLRQPDGSPTPISPVPEVFALSIVKGGESFTPAEDPVVYGPGMYGEDGEYPGAVIVVPFTPPAQGNYQVLATLAGVPIANSPVVVSAKQTCFPGQRVLNILDCLTCPTSSFSTTLNAANCTECPLYSISPPGSDSFFDCTCLPGFWFGFNDNTENRVCLPCPTGGYCAGNGTLPVAAEGFFEKSPGSATFVTCPRANACLGANTCRTGYKGYLCASCAQNYFSDPQQQCLKCPPASSILGTIGFVIILAVAACALVAAVMSYSLAGTATRLATAQAEDDRALSQNGGSGGEHGDDERTSSSHLLKAFRTQLIPPSVSLVVVAFQIVAVLADVDLAWSPASSSVLSAFSVANVDIGLAANECTLVTFAIKFVVTLLAPIVALLVIWVFVVFLSRTAGMFVTFFEPLNEFSLVSIADAVVFSLAPFLYIPTAKSSFLLFDCTQLPDGSFVLDFDPGIACYDTTWWSIFPVGLLGVVLVLGLPVYVAFRLSVAKSMLHTRDTMMRLGSLYRIYRTAYFRGDVYSLVRRLGIVVAAVFFSEYQLAQVALLLAILLVTTYLVISRQPYFDAHHSAVDTRLSVVLVLILLVGAGSYAERNSNPSTSLFFIVLVLLVVALLAVSLHAIGRDIISSYYARSGTYFPYTGRRKALAGLIATELADVEPGTPLSQAAETLVGLLDHTMSTKAPWVVENAADYCTSGGGEFGGDETALIDM